MREYVKKKTPHEHKRDDPLALLRPTVVEEKTVHKLEGKFENWCARVFALFFFFLHGDYDALRITAGNID